MMINLRLKGNSERIAPFIETVLFRKHVIWSEWVALVEDVLCLAQ